MAGTVDHNKTTSRPITTLEWHYTDDFVVFDFNETGFPACMCPFLIAIHQISLLTRGMDQGESRLHSDWI